MSNHQQQALELILVLFTPFAAIIFIVLFCMCFFLRKRTLDFNADLLLAASAAARMKEERLKLIDDIIIRKVCVVQN